jgi:hypothetical protein
MPTLNFVIKNKKNKGLVMNSRELLTLYFYGVPIVNQQGTNLSPTSIETYIRQAQDEVEAYLSIKLNKEVVEEESDYHRDEFSGTGYIRTKLTVNKALDVEGYLGDYKQLDYPREWLTENKVNGLGNTRQILVVPNSNVSAVSINAALFAGSTLPYLGLVNNKSIGSYWHIRYITGYDCDNMPYDLLDVVGKWASIRIFNMLGDLALGPGIASQSLSLDGLSQSVSSTASATFSAFSARITQYTKEVDSTLNRLKGVYKGISLTSI